MILAPVDRVQREVNPMTVSPPRQSSAPAHSNGARVTREGLVGFGVHKAARLIVRRCLSTGLLLSFAVITAPLVVGVCNAAPITYNVDQTIGAGSVIGTIQTDGATGVLGSADIIGWNLELNGVGASINLTNSNSHVIDVGSDVTATAQDLFFNYNGTDNGFLGFQVVLFSGNEYYCNAVTTQGFDCAPGASVVPRSYTDPSAQFEFRTGNQIIGTAATGTVPEPSTLSVMLLGLAGIALAYGSQRAKR